MDAKYLKRYEAFKVESHATSHPEELAKIDWKTGFTAVKRTRSRTMRA